MKKKVAFLLGLVFLVTLLSFGLIKFGGEGGFLRPTDLGNLQKERPLQKYSFASLSKREYSGDEIKLEKILKEEKTYTSWLFSFQSDGKRVTGMLNLPKYSRSTPALPAGRRGTLATRDTFPVIVMLRGYADDEIYFTGLGTRKAAGVFAENSFITLAPDFLGFGSSNSPPEDILEARFERPVTVLNLLASVKTLPSADPERIFLWAHSNGGQIALSVLEISGKDYLTTLWAPVTRGFPESVLDYIGEMDDKGKKVTDRIFEFEKYYDPKEFSIDNYFAQIQAPLLVQQGGGDLLVKQAWTDEFVGKMKSLGKDITYFVYPSADHNLNPNWDTAVARDLEFFKNFL